MKDTWKGYALATASSFLLTTFGGWVFVVRNIPRTAEIREIAREESPYIEDRKAIQDSLGILLDLAKDNDSKLDEIEKRLSRLEASVAAIERELSLRRGSSR